MNTKVEKACDPRTRYTIYVVTLTNSGGVISKEATDSYSTEQEAIDACKEFDFLDSYGNEQRFDIWEEIEDEGSERFVKVELVEVIQMPSPNYGEMLMNNLKVGK